MLTCLPSASRHYSILVCGATQIFHFKALIRQLSPAFGKSEEITHYLSIVSTLKLKVNKCGTLYHPGSSFQRGSLREMTGQVKWRVDTLVSSSMGPCASVASCADSSSLTVKSHRFTVYEDQILKAIQDLSVLLDNTSAVSSQV